MEDSKCMRDSYPLVDVQITLLFYFLIVARFRPQRSLYVVEESSNAVTVCVDLIDDVLERVIVIDSSTLPGSAQGMNKIDCAFTLSLLLC